MAQNNFDCTSMDGKENVSKISKPPLKDVANIPQLRNSGLLSSKVAKNTFKSAEHCPRKRISSLQLSMEVKGSTSKIYKPSNSVSLNGISSYCSQEKSNAKPPVREPKKSSSGFVAKTAPSRIPPYDYKARFNDLLKKHRILKTKFTDVTEELTITENLPQKYEEVQNEIHFSKQELQNKRKEFELLQHETNAKNLKIGNFAKSWNRKRDKLKEMNALYKKLYEDRQSTMIDLLELRQRHADSMERVRSLSDELTIIKNRLREIYEERKGLHNTIMDARGNIRVFCRIRPVLECEKDRPVCEYAFLDETTLEICGPEGKAKAASLTFTFDHMFHPKSTQQDVFEMVSPLIQSALDGYNVCIFAYGETGSGKTYTMEGSANNFGIIPRTVDLLFNSFKTYKLFGWEYEIKVSFLEIYNEVLCDLLNPEQKDMEIRLTKNKDNVYVSNIAVETISTAEQLLELMQKAKNNRATATTSSNERSSRSHSVTRIDLTGYRKTATANEIAHGIINLVDLAGSESPKTSSCMNETKCINRSLSELTNVIMALVQKQEHVPYRNSKLTHLLMPCLGGNSKTLMFVNVSPFEDCFSESIRSLRFASSVNICKTAKIRRNKSFGTPVKASGRLTIINHQIAAPRKPQSPR